MNGISDDMTSFIADCGSSWFKFGHAGDEIPRCSFPSLTCEPIEGSMTVEDDPMDSENIPQSGKQPPCVAAMNFDAQYFDNYKLHGAWDYSKVKARVPDDYQCTSKQGVSERLPSSSDRTDEAPRLDDAVFQKLLHRAFYLTNHGHSDQKGGSMLMAEPDINSCDNRKKITEILFEQMDFSTAYLSRRNVLTLFSVGKTSGISVQVGASGTTVTPVVDGYSLHRSTAWTPFGGNALNELIMKSFQNAGCEAKPSAANRLLFDPLDRTSVSYWRSQTIYDRLKESLCRVAPVSPLKPKAKATIAVASRASFYELPDGTLLDANEPSCLFGPETFFTPQMYKETLPEESIPMLDELSPLHDIVRRVVLVAEPDSRRALVNSISLHGGTAKIPGFQERFAKQLFSDPFLTRIAKPRVHASTGFQDKQFSSFLGASILSSLTSFKQMWMTRAEYEEYGDSVVSMRCL